MIEEIGLLREAFRYVKQRKPFEMEAVVIMPNHLHCIWALPPGDADFSIRWSMLKGHFSRSLPVGERISLSFEFNGRITAFHRPHPAKEAKPYQVEQARDFLTAIGIKP